VIEAVLHLVLFLDVDYETGDTVSPLLAFSWW